MNTTCPGVEVDDIIPCTLVSSLMASSAWTPIVVPGVRVGGTHTGLCHRARINPRRFRRHGPDRSGKRSECRTCEPCSTVALLQLHRRDLAAMPCLSRVGDTHSLGCIPEVPSCMHVVGHGTRKCYCHDSTSCNPGKKNAQGHNCRHTERGP